jgi:hypothetical protein
MTRPARLLIAFATSTCALFAFTACGSEEPETTPQVEAPGPTSVPAPVFVPEPAPDAPSAPQPGAGVPADPGSAGGGTNPLSGGGLPEAPDFDSTLAQIHAMNNGF